MRNFYLSSLLRPNKTSRLAASGRAALGLVLALTASRCATAETDSCGDAGTCVTLSLSADPLAGSSSGNGSGKSTILEDLELIVRVGDTTRRVRFDDRVVRAPGDLALPLPELVSQPQQRLAIYLRARVRASDDPTVAQDVGGAVQRAAADALQARYPLALQRACVGPPCALPEPRCDATLAMDPRSRHLVLFGGRRQDGTALGDTWEWDGIGWNQVMLPPQSTPSARAGQAVALDARRGSLLLFGGAGGTADAPQPLADTWEYLGEPAGWSQVASGGPPARHQAAMASAEVSFLGNGSNLSRPPGVLLHGGIDASGHTLGDTWVWDGHAWSMPPRQSDACPSVPPSSPTVPRCRSQAAIIPTTGSGLGALLVGGRLGPAAPGAAPPEFDDRIWRWDGARWSPAAVSRPPTVLGRFAHYAGLAAASRPLGLVALGDSGAGLRQDAFVLDLSSGSLSPQLGPAPAPRAAAAVAYDDERDEVVLLGGRGEQALYDDTWSFTPASGWRAHR
jgi:hypothetical protein